MKTTITKIIFSLFFLLVVGYSFAQSPQFFNYQAVARDVSGNILDNQSIKIRFTLHKGSEAGAASYSEVHNPTTNNFGLFTLMIGSGTEITGPFDTIAWSKNQYWLQVEMDPTGGGTYTDMGTSQLLSVPYALYAENANVPGVAGPAGPIGPTGAQGPAGNANISGTTNYHVKFTGATTGGNSLIYDNGTNIGIGTTTPVNKLHIAGEISGTTLGVFNHTNGSNFGSNLEFNFSRGTQAAPTSPLSGDALGWINFKGYTGSVYSSGAWLMARASENWSGTANGTNLYIVNTPNGSTSNLYRLTILNNGNLGIGTSTPTAQLHTTGSLLFSGAGTPSAGKVLTSDATGNATWQTPAGSPWLLNGSNLYYNLGNVGIGTNSPGGFLDVNGNSSTTFPHVLLTESENDFSRLMFKTSTSSSKNWTIAAKSEATDANSQLNFNYHNGTTGSDLFTLTGGKKAILNAQLGIGMTPGNDNVEIFRDDLNYIRMYTTSSGTGSTQGFLTGISGVNTYLWNYENGSLQIGTNNMTRMIVLASGNVGIGDSSPEATLDVEGTVTIGSGGVVFSEIKEITGTLDADGVFVFAYPSGYTVSNIRVLSLEINFNGIAWVGLSATDFPTTNVTKVFYYLSSTQIYIYYPSVAAFHNRDFRMLVMKVQ